MHKNKYKPSIEVTCRRHDGDIEEVPSDARVCYRVAHHRGGIFVHASSDLAQQGGD